MKLFKDLYVDYSHTGTVFILLSLGSDQGVITSVPSTVRNLRKMRNFWANFTDFKSEIDIIKCKTLTKNLNILMQGCSTYLGKANLMQKICKRGPQSSEIFGQKFQ